MFPWESGEIPQRPDEKHQLLFRVVGGSLARRSSSDSEREERRLQHFRARLCSSAISAATQVFPNLQ